MAFTLAEKTAFRDEFKAAYLAVINGKSYTISTGGTTRVVTRQDAEWLRKEMFFWDEKVTQEQSGKQSGLPTKFGTPIR